VTLLVFAERCISEMIMLHAFDRAQRKINEYKHSEIVEIYEKDKKDYPDLEEKLRVAHYEHEGAKLVAGLLP